MTGERVLWSREWPKEGEIWQLGQVDLPAFETIGQVVFEIVAGPGPGDYAVRTFGTDSSSLYFKLH